MARTISVEIVGDASSLERSFKRASTDAARFDRSMGRTFRGVVAGSGAFHSLGRSVAFASSAFLGGAGFVAAVTSTVKAAENAQKVLGQTRVAVERSGQSWSLYGKQVQEAALAQSKLSGFDDEQLLQTFSNLVRRTNDVNQALKLNALAADVARGRSISLEQASQLVLKASIGNTGALRRLGINIDKNADSFQALDLLQKKYAGSAAAYGRTAAGAQDRFRVAVENLQEAVGSALLPSITRYLNKGADWLNQSRNQKKIVDDVKAAVGALEEALKVLKDVMDGLNKVTGSTTNSLKLLLAAFVVFKTARIVGVMTGVAESVGLVGARAATSRTAVLSLRGSLIGLAATAALMGRGGGPGDKLSSPRDWLHALDPRNWLNDIKSVFGIGPGGTPTMPAAGPAATQPNLFRSGYTGARLKAYISAAAQRAGLDPNAVLAVASAEGGFAGAVGDRGTSFGPFQLHVGGALPKGLAGVRGKVFAQSGAGIDYAIRQIAKVAGGLTGLEAVKAIVTRFERPADRGVGDIARARAYLAGLGVVPAAGGGLHLPGRVSGSTSFPSRIPGRVTGAAAGLQFPLNLPQHVTGVAPFHEIPGRVSGAYQFLRPSFETSPLLQLAQARAQALGQNMQPILRRMRTAAQKALKSGRLSIEAQIDAWNTIAQVNDQLKSTVDKAAGDVTKFQHVDAKRLAAKLGQGLTAKQRHRLELGLAALGPGYTLPAASQQYRLAGGGGIVINGNVNVHGVSDVKHIEQQLTKRAKSRPHTRRGAR